jgi:phosphate butyryltransferase
MQYTKFEQLVHSVVGRNLKTRCAVVSAEDPYTIQAVVRAYHEGLINPILIGDEAVIADLLADQCCEKKQVNIIHVKDHNTAVQTAIDLSKNGEADCIMKGLIKTADFMRAVLKKENQLRTDQLVSMLSIREMPNYHKLIAFTDAGICMYPSLDEKRQIIENAVSAMTAMGFDMPKVGVLAAVEVVNPKMPESVDADKLKKMNQEGVIKGCVVEGPISYDVAVSREAAEIKGVKNDVVGDVDLLVFPDIVSGNITTKAITRVSGVPVGSLILGTKIPVILSSRSSSAVTKYMCIALAAAANPVRVNK